MPSSRTPPRAPSYAGSIGSVDGPTPNAALLGAALAFGRRQPTQESPQNGRSVQGGTTRSRTASPEGMPSVARVRHDLIARQGTGQREQNILPVRAPRELFGEPAKKSITQAPDVSARSTAVVAASRAHGPETSMVADSRVSKPAAPPKPRRLSKSGPFPDLPTDRTPIPPTSSLIGMFEKKATTTSESNANATRVRSPTFESALSTSLGRVQGRERVESPSSLDEVYVSASEDTAATPSPRPTNPTQPIATILQPPTPRQPRFSPSPNRPPTSSTQPVDIKPPPRHMSTSRPAMSASQNSAQSITATYNQLYSRNRSMTPLGKRDDIANAIVASSLASSRAGSPGKLEPPSLPPSRRSSHAKDARMPSPAKKGMRLTLRSSDPESSDSEDDFHPYGKHKKKRHLRKHPNKHHEGERKRWREAVTERERKRYEGVWAANRGLHCALQPAEQRELNALGLGQAQEALRDQVAGIVVQDIWSRSRLPEHELEAVWELVDSTGTGRLGKEEFVVGLWLIDQRLKGRKLPTKVSATVWASVKGIEGIKVKKFLG